MEASHTVFEGFIELAESADDKVNKVIDVGIGLFFDIDGIDFSFGLVFSDAE